MTSPQHKASAIDVTITAVAHGGDGIGRIHGLTCFVAGALPGDTVRVSIYRRASNAVWGRLLEVLSPSPYREDASACAGRACMAACSWRDFAYPAQGEWKQQIVAETIRRIGGIHTEVAFIEMPELRFGYRTRAIFHGDGDHLGYYKPRTHDVIPMVSCPLLHDNLNAALGALRPHDIRGKVQVTVNPEGEETLVWLRDAIPAVKARFPLTNCAGDAEPCRFVFDGAPIVNGAFSQASLLLNRMLRHETDARIGDAPCLLDLYCGNGNLSLRHADQRQVLGIDHAAAAVAAANVLAPGVYRRGDESFMAAMIQKQAWDVILLDPPRVGAKALVAPLAKARAARLVYVSCDPATFARDARGLAAGGWRLTDVAALDLFPHTPHVETIGVFERSGKEKP